ncbi:acyl-CoA dehydrogenase family protein [Microbacterium luticocti]|uniref:acyl-CoA dehydrogenase family protein n=1 Tax=Microbacterium luticocti TaxID=451764 RepID=UPI000425339E|nr:acyl-CoA dehydrogenase family protein [Microbacterium luticocti]
MRLVPTQLSEAELGLRADVRAFLDERLVPGTYRVGLGLAGDSDPAFSRDLGARGWLGMSLPVEYGGGGRSAVERLIVVEELLARGAPVGYHWIADRQSGPNIAAFGTEAQKSEFLPGIARGELSFAIGMSEPDSGSDLASVRSRAERVDGGWLVNGTKIWTTGATHATHIIALLRTSPDRHEGLTQFIIDAGSPGITISPIEFIDGSADFCEVSFVDVFVPADRLLGAEGRGWSQNTAELALERGGVDRWMSVMPLLEDWARRLGVDGDDGHSAFAQQEMLGSIVARAWSFRQMALSIARMVDHGQSPVAEAALVKEMATRFEQECVARMAAHFPGMPRLHSEDAREALLAEAILVSPSWTIRGGTNEILRSIIGKDLKNDRG